MKRVLIIGTLLAILAVPFALRPPREGAGRSDDTVVIITPHNEAIRYEYARGFAAWYRARTGRTVGIDWRMVGGTSDIARFLEGEYVSAFELHWTRLGREWSAEIQAGFQNGRLPESAPAVVREARATFLASNVSCGIDVFFGGGTYDLDRQAAAGRLVDSGVVRAHPEWFNDEVIPRRFGGEEYWRADGLWVGTVLSTYGIIFNRDALQRLGITREPRHWADLADPRFVGEVGLSDPTKSGSVAKAFESILQQEMQRRLAAPGAAPDEARAVREGWVAGLQLVQRIGANARYFTDTSQKPPIDVAAGNCAAGLAIDFYGRQQQEAIRRRDHSERIGFVTPPGGSVASVDPIALLRGAPHRAVAEAFIEYSLTLEAQRLWNLRVGAPGGPQRFALRRLPVRKDFYQQADLKALRSDPEVSPYTQEDPLIYREAWTGRLFREMGFVVRVMCLDTHRELRAAWRAIHAAPEPRRTRALAVMQDLSAVSYDRVATELRARLGAKDKVEEVRAAKELGEVFRANYLRAEAIALGREE